MLKSAILKKCSCPVPNPFFFSGGGWWILNLDQNEMDSNTALGCQYITDKYIYYKYLNHCRTYSAAREQFFLCQFQGTFCHLWKKNKNITIKQNVEKTLKKLFKRRRNSPTLTDKTEMRQSQKEFKRKRFYFFLTAPRKIVIFVYNICL